MTVVASSSSPVHVRAAVRTRWLGYTARQHLAASAIFAAVTVLFFFPLLTGHTLSEVAAREQQVHPWAGATAHDDDSVVHYDQTDSFYPWQVFMSRAFRNGEFPLWNPHSFGGAPFFANGQSGALYPPRLALTYTVSPTRAHDLLLATHLFLAGAAMFLLLGFSRVSFLSAMVGGLAWMLNSFALAWQALEHYVVIGAWLPIGVLLVSVTVRRRSWPAAFGLALVLGLMFLGGNALFAELAIAAIFGYGIALAIADAGRRWRALGGSIARLATVGVLLAGLTAVALLPTLSVSADSARASLQYDELDRFALDWTALVHVFKPPPDPVSVDPYHHALFAGTAVAILALFGLMRQAALARFAAVLGVLTTLFMLHTPVTFVIANVLPGLGSLKPLSRAAFLLQFALAILAAFGLDLVRQWLRSRRTGEPGRSSFLGRERFGAIAKGRRLWPSPSPVAIVVGAVLGGLILRLGAPVVGSEVAFVLALAWPPAAAFAFDVGMGRVRARTIVRSSHVVGAFSGALVAVLVVHFMLSESRPVIVAVLAATAVVATALGLSARRTSVLPRMRGRFSFPSSRVAGTVLASAVAASIVWQAHAWADEVMLYQPNRSQLLYPSTPLVRFLEREPAARFLPTGPSFRGSTAMISSLQSAGGYESLVPRRTESLWRTVAQGVPSRMAASSRRTWAYHPQFELEYVRPTLLARAGVAYVVASPSDVITWYRTPAGHVVFREPGYYNPVNPYDTGRPGERNTELERAYGPFDSSWEGEAISWYRTPDGRVVYREPGYYNPVNPYDTGRPGERNTELVRAYGPLRLAREGEVFTFVPNGLELLYNGRDGRVFSVAGALPSAYVVGGCEHSATPIAALRRFVDPAFDARRSVILESRGAAATCKRSTRGRVGVASITDRSLNRVRVAVDATRQGWLVLTESWDDAWRAEVDGDAVEVSPANYAFRAVPIEPGRHVVTFSYQPAEVRIGAVVSVTTVLVSTLGLFASTRRPSRRRQVGSPGQSRMIRRRRRHDRRELRLRNPTVRGRERLDI